MSSREESEAESNAEWLLKGCRAIAWLCRQYDEQLYSPEMLDRIMSFPDADDAA